MDEDLECFDQEIFESMNDHLEDRQCGRCMEKQCATEYSQGTPVCKPCKAITLNDDKRAFDRDMSFR